MTASSRRIAVIGAGISGLATAFWLNEKGCSVTLLEERSRVGGSIETVVKDGFLIELGPNNALETTPLIQNLVAELRIKDQLIYANASSKNRYIVRAGKMHRVPFSPIAFLSTPLFSSGAKLRLLREPFIRGGRNPSESLSAFVRRRFGSEFLDYAINPFVAGVYAGDPKQLSVAAAFPKLYELEQTYGSVLRGAVAGRKERKRREKRGEISKQSARLFSFDRGLSTLTEAIAQRLGPKILLNSKATAIIALDGRSGRGRYEVSFTQGQDVGTLEVDAVVLSSPAYAASRLIRGMDGVLAEGMEKVIYPPVSMVFLGYESSRIRKLPDGFGFLVPEVENRKILGTIWSSSIFPGRAPTGCVAFTTFVGGSRQPHLGLGPEEELLENVKNELDYFHGIRGEPACEVVKTWKLSIPQYVVGYTDFLGRLDKFEKNHPGFFFCANFRGGIALGDCIKNAGQTLSKVQEYLA